jgi:hypothetical protein
MDARQVSDRIGRIRNILATVSTNIRAVFRGQPPIPETNVVCAPSTDAECRVDAANPRHAYVVGHGPLIHICPEYFRGTDRSGEDDRVAGMTQGLVTGAPTGTDRHEEEVRIHEIIHESGHVAEIGTMSGECYDGPPFSCGDPSERMLVCDTPDGHPSDPDRAHWADTWALAVTCMSGHGESASSR